MGFCSQNWQIYHGVVVMVYSLLMGFGKIFDGINVEDEVMVYNLMSFCSQN